MGIKGAIIGGIVGGIILFYGTMKCAALCPSWILVFSNIHPFMPWIYPIGGAIIGGLISKK